MDFYQKKNPRLLLALGLGISLLLAGAYGSVSESDLALLAFYGVLIGGGLFLLGYSVLVWRRAE